MGVLDTLGLEVRVLVWIVRHGKAESAAEARDDWVRCLVARGERQARHVGQAIAARDERPAVIVSSPVTRAAQTARAIAREVDVPVMWSAHLETERPVSDALVVMEAARRHPCIMLVGHNYQLSELLVALVRGQPGVGSGELGELRTGEAALVRAEPARLIGSGVLVERLRLDEE